MLNNTPPVTKKVVSVLMNFLMPMYIGMVA